MRRMDTEGSWEIADNADRLQNKHTVVVDRLSV